MITKGERVVARHVIMADSFIKRLKGLIFMRPLEAGEAMVIVPCNGVHTWFMKYPIDVVLCDRTGTILRCVPCVPPWRLGPFIRKAHFVIEMPTNSIEQLGLVPGDRLVVKIDRR